MGITKYLTEAENDFEIYGEVKNGWENFQSGTQYNGFLVRRKKLQICSMKISELNKRKVPIVKIDKSLNKYNDVVLFPEKLEKANEMLRSIGLPKAELAAKKK